MELKEAVHWLEQAVASKRRKPTELQERYIRASEEWEAGEIQRLKDLNAERERQARIAIARERVAFSTLSLEEDPERSILLAMHAVDATRSADQTVIPEAEDALHRAIWRSQVRLTLRGHKGRIESVAVTPDGKLAVSASRDSTLKVWKLASGRPSRTLRGHKRAVTAVAITRDGKLAISAAGDFLDPRRELKVWDVASARALRTLQGHSGPINSLALSGDGRLAVSASSDHTLKVWDLASGRKLRTLKGHSETVNGGALSRDGRLAVSASWDKTLKVWDVNSGRELRTLDRPL